MFFDIADELPPSHAVELAEIHKPFVEILACMQKRQYSRFIQEDPDIARSAVQCDVTPWAEEVDRVLSGLLQSFVLGEAPETTNVVDGVAAAHLNCLLLQRLMTARAQPPIWCQLFNMIFCEANGLDLYKVGR